VRAWLLLACVLAFVRDGLPVFVLLARCMSIAQMSHHCVYLSSSVEVPFMHAGSVNACMHHLCVHACTVINACEVAGIDA